VSFGKRVMRNSTRKGLRQNKPNFEGRVSESPLIGLRSGQEGHGRTTPGSGEASLDFCEPIPYKRWWACKSGRGCSAQATVGRAWSLDSCALNEDYPESGNYTEQHITFLLPGCSRRRDSQVRKASEGTWFARGPVSAPDEVVGGDRRW
jgi:hypothetical protein